MLCGRCWQLVHRSRPGHMWLCLTIQNFEPTPSCAWGGGIKVNTQMYFINGELRWGNKAHLSRSQGACYVLTDAKNKGRRLVPLRVLWTLLKKNLFIKVCTFQINTESSRVLSVNTVEPFEVKNKECDGEASPELWVELTASGCLENSLMLHRGVEN